jgi:hypothetical protein
MLFGCLVHLMANRTFTIQNSNNIGLKKNQLYFYSLFETP